MKLERLKESDSKEIKVEDLTVSEIKYVIEETVFAKEIDIQIATLRFTKSMSFEKIAEAVGYEQRRSIQIRLVDIEDRMNKTIKKLLK